MSYPTVSPGEGVHQAIDLFDKIELNLDLEPAFLDKKDDFEDWHCDITNRLYEMGLDKLIDINIARPHKDHKSAPKWRKLSILIARWLELSISEELLTILRAQGQPTTLADEFMSAAIKAFRKPDARAKMAMVGRFFELKEDMFKYMCDFIHALQTRYAAMRDAGIEIPPFVVLNYLLYELDTENNEDLIKYAMDTLASMGYAEFDLSVAVEDLNDFFDLMMAYLDEQDDDYDDDAVLG